jgi:predicted Zn-dependent peptidase
MIKYILDNKIKLIYEQKTGALTSFCIGFNAGALEEEGVRYGVAHAVEHMVYKGTKNRSEAEINNLSDEIFGFSNAMTNYPYTIYYGTVGSEDFHKGFELMSDIVMNPIFPESGFQEEMKVIEEELKDWKEDFEQHCEDILLSNAFSNRRIKELIIGNKESIESITLKDIRNFYDSYYCPENCVISVVSSHSYEEVLSIVENCMGEWNKNFKGLKKVEYETNRPGLYRAENSGAEGAKIQYVYSIHDLSEAEIKMLSVFNLILGDGSSSILFDTIRNQRGLAYEVYSTIKNERGIKLFTISVSTSKKHIEKVIHLIDECIAKMINNKYEMKKFEKAAKSYKLKQEFLMERSVELSKRLTTYELMFQSCDKVYDDLKIESSCDFGKINELLHKVFKEPTIQVLS